MNAQDIQLEGEKTLSEIRAQAVLQLYQIMNSSDVDLEEDVEFALFSLLSDLWHWCQSKQIRIHDVLAIAQQDIQNRFSKAIVTDFIHHDKAYDVNAVRERLLKH